MINDLRYALRTLRRSPGFAASAILALALGIGANTAVFSVVHAVLWKALPYPEPDRLVRLHELNVTQGVEAGEVSTGTFVDWRQRSRTLQGLAVYTIPFGGQTLWTLGDQVQIIKTSAVSPSLFALLGVEPILGRALRPEGDGAAPGSLGQFVISYGLWQRAFGGAPNVVGRTVMIEGRLPREIVGVMPRGFAFPEGTEAWTSVPLGSIPVPERRSRSFQVVARLAPGVTLRDASREIDGLSAQLASEQPASNGGWTAHLEPLAGSDSSGAKPALLALMAAVAGVLLIGCANAANLLFARATARRREMAVRAALGADAWILARQCLTEAAVLSLCGVAAGMALASWLAGVLVRLAPPDIPRLGDVGPSGAAFLFAAAAGILSVVLTGVAPALSAARADVRGGLRPDVRASTPHGARLRRSLIAGEVAIVVLLLTGALLLVRTFVNLRGVDLGFEPEHAMMVEARWPVGHLFQAAPGAKAWPRVQRAVDGLIAAIEDAPGVAAAGLISDVPLTGNSFDGAVWRADAPGASGLTPPADPRHRWKADLAVVTSGYFPAMDIPVLRGRNFTAADRLSDLQLTDLKTPRTGSVIINAAFAAQYFPGEDPVGRTLVLYDDQTFGAARTVIGVVANVRGRAITEAPRPAAFIPHGQHPDVFRPSIIVRSTGSFAAVSGALRQRLATYDRLLLVLQIRPLDAVVSGALSRPRFNLLLLSAFAGVALVLSSVGIYGVVAFLVTQRTREIGIRMALGAHTSDVLRLVLREGMAPVAFGAIAGVLASLAATRAIRTMLFGVTPLDPVSFAAAPLVLAAVALLACYLPARRATGVDPLVALRDE